MWLRANGPGIGDALFLTAVAHEIKKQKKEFVGIASYHRELFENNPDIDATTDLHDYGINAVTFRELDDQKSIKEHNVQFMLKKIGCIAPIWEDIRQYVYLRDDELLRHPKKYITISASTSNWTPNKTWFGFKDLVSLIKQKSEFIVYQLAGNDEEKIPGCQFLNVPLRKVAAYLKGSQLHICCITGTMHMASGVGTRSIVLYGGRERAFVTGYHNNINIETNPPQKCGGCYLVHPCPYGYEQDGKFKKPCLEMINPEEIYKIANDLLKIDSHKIGLL